MVLWIWPVSSSIRKYAPPPTRCFRRRLGVKIKTRVPQQLQWSFIVCYINFTGRRLSYIWRIIFRAARRYIMLLFRCISNLIIHHNGWDLFVIECPTKSVTAKYVDILECCNKKRVQGFIVNLRLRHLISLQTLMIAVDFFFCKTV